MSDSSAPASLSFPAKVAIGVLAVFGVLAGLQWVIGALFGLVRLVFLLALVVGIAGLFLWGGPDNDE